MQKGIVGMSTTLLVRLEDCAVDVLFWVSTSECAPFKVWKDRDGVDLFWMGRRVEEVYSLGEEGDRWWSVPIPAAVRSLLKRGKAKRVKAMPAPEGELPR
jgi:hypothetical protein